jgi:hypothetical protein
MAAATLTAFTALSAAALDVVPSTAFAAGGDHAAQWQQFSSELKGKYAGKQIRLIMINDPFLPAFNKMTEAFSTLTGAKVSVDTFGYDPTYQKEVLACGQNDKTYDIIVFRRAVDAKVRAVYRLTQRVRQEDRPHALAIRRFLSRDARSVAVEQRDRRLPVRSVFRSAILQREVL